MRYCDWDSTKAFLIKFTDYIAQNMSENMNQVRLYLMQLIASSIKLAYELEIEEQLITGFQGNIFERVLKEETIQNVVSYLEDFYNDIQKAIEQRKNVKSRELVTSIKGSNLVTASWVTQPRFLAI